MTVGSKWERRCEKVEMKRLRHSISCLSYYILGRFCYGLFIGFSSLSLLIVILGEIYDFS